jgi:GNAT superfamily N-acetyltransferase
LTRHEATVYARNAAAMWASLAPGYAQVLPSSSDLAVITIPGHLVTRIVAQRAMADRSTVISLMIEPSPAYRVVLEDPFDAMGAASGDAADRTPIMIRPVADAAASPLPPRACVAQVQATEDLAGACYTYDDGTAVGIYRLATLPEHRFRGIGRAVMNAALAAHPHRPAVLASSTPGQPLYASLGFQTVSTMAWHWSKV